jgi:glutathione synthase/RimK-type ligase-like ATP-grasp enzyme
MQVVRNDKPFPQQNVEMVFRWGTTSNVSTNNVVNTARAIHEVADKRTFRMKLDEAELCPATWESVEDFLNQGDGNPPVYPVILRRAKHHQGRWLHVCDNLGELQAAARRYGEGNYYISEYVEKAAEYRVFVVQGRVACVAQKTPANPEAVAWNVAKGGRFDNVRWDNWPLKAVRKSVEAFNLSGLDFGGVDVMVDANGEAYIIEINSAPSLTSPYRQEAMAKCFDYIVRNGKEQIPLTQERGGYRKFIHPAVCDRAIVVGD